MSDIDRADNPDAVRRQVEAACRRGDTDALWSLTRAFLAQHAGARSVSRHTLRSYRQSLDLLFSRWGGETVLHPSEAEVAEFVRGLEASGASLSTIKVRLAGIRAFYRALVGAGVIQADPFARERPQAPEGMTSEHRTPYSAAEREALLHAAKPVDAALIMLLGNGLQVSECVALGWSNVDLKGRRIHVPRGAGRPDRVVPLSSDLLFTLQSLPHADGNRLLGFATDVRARQRIQRLCEQTGVPYRGVYALRREPVGERRRKIGAEWIEAKDAEQVHRVEVDTVTGLPSPGAFEEELQRVLSAAQRTQDAYGLLVVHLNDLTNIDEEHGRAVSEEILRALAARINRSRRPYDFLAYAPGKTFHLLVKDVATDADLRSIANRIRHVVCANPVAVQNTEVGVAATISASRGIQEPLQLWNEAAALSYTAN